MTGVLNYFHDCGSQWTKNKRKPIIAPATQSFGHNPINVSGCRQLVRLAVAHTTCVTVTVCRTVCFHFHVSICNPSALPLPLVHGFSALFFMFQLTDVFLRVHTISIYIYHTYIFAVIRISQIYDCVVGYFCFPRYSQWLRGAALNCRYQARHRLNSA